MIATEQIVGGLLNVKILWYIATIAVFEYLGIPKMQFLFLGILMLADSLTGAAKQYVLDPAQLRSHAWWIWVIKKMCTLILVFSLAITAKSVGLDPEFYLIWAMAALTVAEFYSIIQNVYTVHTKQKLSEYDAASAVISVIGNLFAQLIETLLEKFKKPKI